MKPFAVARLPRIEFAAGAFANTAATIQKYGQSVLVVTGRHSFVSSPHWQQLIDDFNQRQISWWHCRIDGEPTPEQIDAIVDQFGGETVDVVLGIGGGSALDAAKAIAGLLRVQQSVMDFLEGVGPQQPYLGPALPFVAVPTTAGTGSEATKNAVLSRQGDQGFKKSFRDERLVPQVAIVDPDLLASCPPSVIAANGMDALTQLLESYVSLKAGPFTDALAESGLKSVRDGLRQWFRQEGNVENARAHMAYAALLSGITLAQVGLGCVHGLASPLGAFYPVPHGVACGRLLATATAANIAALLERDARHPALVKYARAAELLHQQVFDDQSQALTALVDLLEQWTEELGLPGLHTYGLNESGLDAVVAQSRGSSMQTNPVRLSDDELRGILERCL